MFPHRFGPAGPEGHNRPEAARQLREVKNVSVNELNNEIISDRQRNCVHNYNYKVFAGDASHPHVGIRQQYIAHVSGDRSQAQGQPKHRRHGATLCTHTRLHKLAHVIGLV